VYGPGQRDHFIPEFFERAKSGDLSLKGWENTRSFMYISDAVRATIQIIFDANCSNQIINVGVDNEISIKDLATMILCEAGIVGELVLEPAPLGSVKRRCGNLEKMNRLLNFVSEVSLAQGIKRTLESL
jgi:nucleoside-diphosphate-sugar epimerase